MLAKTLLGSVVMVAAMAQPVAAFAAGPDFCRDYAEAAVRQAHEVREIPFCARVVRFDPARWSEDRRGHFEWCRAVPPDVAIAERDARTHHLHECRRHE
jgi:hypothetical protein